LNLVNESSEEYIIIKNYINATGSVRELKVFSLIRRDEQQQQDNFDEEERKALCGNPLLLWHGTKAVNYLSILATGLRIAPPNAERTGAMFGDGIYFADVYCKARGYCTPLPDLEKKDANKSFDDYDSENGSESENESENESEDESHNESDDENENEVINESEYESEYESENENENENEVINESKNKNQNENQNQNENENENESQK